MTGETYTYPQGIQTSADIAKVKEYLKGILDQVAVKESITGYMTPDPYLFAAGQRAGEFNVPTISLDGLADYDRTHGYAQGEAELSFETYKLECDRGRSFTLDAVDVMQEDGILQATSLMSEFVRSKVVPEMDAYRICKLAGIAKTAGNVRNQTATNYAKDKILGNILSAIRSVKNNLKLNTASGIKLHVNTDYMDALEGSTEMIRNHDMQSAVRRLDNGVEVINGAEVIETPPEYMSTALTLGTGSFTPSGDTVVALAVAPGVANGLVAHNVSNIFPPGIAQGVDGSIVEYRVFHDCLVMQNKIPGIYALTLKTS